MSTDIVKVCGSDLQSNEAAVHSSALLLREALLAADTQRILGELDRLRALGAKQTFASVAAVYEKGLEGIERRLDLAFDWYTKSAKEENDCLGYFGLARFHFDGRHVQRNYARAVQLFEIAHQLGCDEAGVMLGYCYLRGFGVYRDISAAEKYLSRPVQLGFILAQYMLSRIEFERMHYRKAAILWCRAVFGGQSLRSRDPGSVKLYGLNDFH